MLYPVLYEGTFEEMGFIVCLFVERERTGYEWLEQEYTLTEPPSTYIVQPMNQASTLP